MQGIEFEDDKDFQGLKASGLKVGTFEVPVAKQGPFLKLLEKAGIDDKATGNFVILGIAAILFGIAMFLYAGILGENVPSKQSTEEIMAQLKVLKEMQKIK
ncbi:MAG: hypothetical protein UW27_C0011G0017 [Parcubacteria group bacterium GW2011_GWA1_44_13]|uniref:Uncharacterized protein n=1 Tax=Candidatus Nomurabacteria bacterium GW2011_GWB1_44_12 TaxID=1618748 RepID=A0A837ICD8_9BACT|nr:MAG: hypothetical protein UW25_C0007G0018 [Candidatus Nomurabacteria bacterium GW2011_GWB1_44_12]KKT37695.1 MAG: hypothetical protein UW27_C0011G0017 [Parcubacteria group bacterium GW2011_GWA1_44_13]HBB44191.1 hypothetical protein [Candidatus Yonathbacteria bacterium]